MNTIINGKSTAFTDHPGSEPALICIHGNSLSRAEFSPLLESERLKKYRIITYDLPGHGESDSPVDHTVTCTLRGYADHLAALIRYLGIERYILFGVSLGGHIAIEAVAEGLRPAPAGIVTFGTPPLGGVRDLPEAFLPGPEGPSLFQAEISLEEAEGIVYLLTDDPEVRKRCVQEILSTDPKARTALMAGLGLQSFHDEIDFVHRTEISLLLGFGEKERVVSMKYLEDRGLFDGLKDSLRIFEGCAHLPDMASNGEFIKELVSFLERFDT